MEAVKSVMMLVGALLLSVAGQGQARPAAPDSGLGSGLGSGPVSGMGLTFTLDRTGAAAMHYSVQLNQVTGKGVYRGAPAKAGAVSAAGGGDTAGGTGAGMDLPIAVGGAVLQKVFAAAPLVKSNRCASHRKGIAQTGTKTLRLVVGGASFECSYNYSEDERVNEATTALEAVAETIQYGERLRSELRFDRLGLDAEMDGLQSALTDGRALEVGNIAPVLQAIENDDRVMERVRRKAARLLETAGMDGDGNSRPS